MSYFDNNATTPMHARALESFGFASKRQWRNPSSPYRKSAEIKARLSRARDQWADMLGVESGQVTFTSGATESNNRVIAAAAAHFDQEARILISGLEHPSVSEPARHWFGDRVDLIPQNSLGMVCMESFQSMIEKPNPPALVCIMAASNESGVIQPWLDAANLCSERKIPFHCDATQWVGKMPVADLKSCTSFTASAHKFGGPKGIGWLVDSGENLLQLGGGQEGGRRAGTENFPAIEAMGIAWEETCNGLSNGEERSAWRDEMESFLQSELEGTQVIGLGTDRLWNTSFLLMPKYENLRWVDKLEALGFEVSTGSACSIGSLEVPPSVKAYSLDSMEAKRLVRVSSYLGHLREDWIHLGNAFLRAWEQLSEESHQSNVISI